MFVFFGLKNVEFRLYFLVILNYGRVISEFAEKKKTVRMSKEFEIIQRTIVFLRFPGHVYISFLKFYTTERKEHVKNVSGSNNESNKNIQFRFSLGRGIRRFY